ncbi:MAG: phosphoribosylaminoimidazolesuccinocarboxamide synthase [Rummeliibacillus sp.]
MELIYKGTTKDVYKIDENHFVLQFKHVLSDQGVTSHNNVGTTTEIMNASHSLTTYFYKRLKAIDIPTYYLSSNMEEATITVKSTTLIGNGLIVLCQFPSANTLWHYDQDGHELEDVVSISYFEDEHQNDSIAKSILFEKGILSKDEEQSLELLSIDISNFVRTELAKKGLKLHEIKLKFGRDTQNGDLLLIDEISGQNIIAYQDTKYITPLLLDKIILNK